VTIRFQELEEHCEELRTLKSSIEDKFQQSADSAAKKDAESLERVNVMHYLF